MDKAQGRPRLYRRGLEAGQGSKVTLSSGGRDITCDLYTEEGMALVAGLWVKLSAEFRRMYEPSWLGVPVIQLPEDIVAMQELIWRLRPDIIIETGVAHGGSLILYASICEMIGHGRVVGIDIEIRKYNRVAMQAHPMWRRIALIEGSSVDAATFEKVQAESQGARTVLVTLDSNHTRAHVAKELDLYHGLVTPGSYLVAADGAQADVWDIPRGKPEWRNDHPSQAIEEFLKRHPEFVNDPHYTRLSITSTPGGFLRKLTQEETKAG